MAIVTLWAEVGDGIYFTALSSRVGEAIVGEGTDDTCRQDKDAEQRQRISLQAFTPRQSAFGRRRRLQVQNSEG